MTYPEPPAQGDTLPAVSPNGRFLVFQRVLGSNAAELHLLPLGDGMSAAGPPRRIASVAVSGLAPAWTPRSDEIVFSAQGGLWRMGITGAQAPVRLPFGEDGFMPAVSIPQPGKPSRLAYVRSFSDFNIYKVETPAVGAPASAQPSVAIASTRIDRGARFSPDGRRVAFTSDRSGWPEIWISDPDGSGAAQLTFLKAPNAAVPTWSPDGQTIAFESNAEGQNEIYSMSSGGGKPRRLTTHPANDKYPQLLTRRQMDLFSLEPRRGRPDLESARGGWRTTANYLQHRACGAGIHRRRMAVLYAGRVSRPVVENPGVGRPGGKDP